MRIIIVCFLAIKRVFVALAGKDRDKYQDVAA
jgi:hypothetical protein